MSRRPAVAGGMLYFPDWAGNIWAVNSNNGMRFGHTSFRAITGMSSGTVHSRTTPAVMRNIVYVATQEEGVATGDQCRQGTLLWKTQLEAVILMPHQYLARNFRQDPQYRRGIAAEGGSHGVNYAPQ